MGDLGRQRPAGHLKGKRALFVQEYLVDLNATQAAIRAGYSPRTAAETGYDLLRNPQIQTAIQAAMAERGERTKVTGDRVIQELGFVALSDIGEVLNIDPSGLITVRCLDDLTPSARRCIKSIKQTTHQYVVGRGESAQEMEKVILQVELHPKVQALELLMDHHGLKKPTKHEHMGEGGGPIPVQNTVRYVIAYPEEEPDDAPAPPAESRVH